MSDPFTTHDRTGRLRGATSSPVRDILALTERPGVVSFAGGLPAPDLFDRAGLQAAFTAVLGEDSGARALQYSTTEGDPLLRRLVAQRLTERGLDTAADDLLITSGSQQALTLVAAVLLEPGDRVLVEEPSYLAALQCFALAGAQAIPIPCDDGGLDPDALDALIAEHRPTLLYTVPTFHNPTGRTLSLERRLALAEVAERTGVWIVEDDPYGELRYSGEALPAVASLTAGARPDARHLHAVQDRRPGAAHRLGPRTADAVAVADDRQAGRRPALLDRRPGGGGALAGHHRPRRPHRAPARRVRRPARRAARRAGRRAAGRLHAQPPRRGHVRVGAPARRLGRGTRCCSAPSIATSPTSPARRSSPARPMPPRCACPSPRTGPTRSRWGSSGWRRRWPWRRRRPPPLTPPGAPRVGDQRAGPTTPPISSST